MRPRGTIYNFRFGKTRGSVEIALSRFTKFSYRFVSSLGAGLIAYFILSFLFTFGPLIQEEVNYSLGLNDEYSRIAEETAIKVAEADDIIAVQKEADSWGVNSYFSVAIPKINASANVIANVDTTEKSEYLEALKNGVAHARGTYFPGQNNNIFLFSHSTDSPLNIARYNAVFYLLRKLDTGDRIIIYFADKKYEYEVYDKFVTDPTDTTLLTEDVGFERLILMTCDPPGTTWRRLFVVAKPVSP